MAGSLVLLSGEPGIGKSTLSLQMSDWYSSTETPVLYVSGEESVLQISGRARRLGVHGEYIDILSDSDFESISFISFKLFISMFPFLNQLLLLIRCQFFLHPVWTARLEVFLRFVR